MRYKKIMILTIILTFLLAVSAVSAAENATYGVIVTDFTNEDVIVEDGQIIEHIENKETLILKNGEIKVNEDEIDGELEFNNQKELLSQHNDDELGASLTKTQISVSNYTAILNPSSTYFTITKLSANVKTTSGKSINKGGVYFVINQNSYSKIETYGVGVEHGIASHDFSYKAYYSPGKYKCTAYYSDFSNTYESSSCEFYLTVKTKTELSVNDIQCNIGDTITINPSIKSATGSESSKYGDFVYIVNFERYTTGKSLSLTMNTPGKLKCSVKYVGNSYYLNSSEITFYINVRDYTNVVYSLNSGKVLAGDNITINYKVVDGQENTIYVGSDKITLPNKPGQYTHVIRYKESSMYQSSSKRFNIDVYSKSIISCDLTKSYVGKTEDINIIVKDHLGQDINEGIVKSTINGKTYSANVKNGKAIFNNVKMPLTAKTYQYTINYSTDSDFYTNSSHDLQITCTYSSKVTVKSITGYEGKKTKLTAIVIDSAGNKIKKGTVKFKVKGKTYTAKVKNGKATVTIKLPIAKKYKTATKSSGNKRTVTTYYKSVYNCKATFSGYKQYPSSSTKFKVTSKDKPYSYSYYVAKKKTSSSSSSTKKSTQTYKFSVPHAHATVDVIIYTGSRYNTYSTGTNWLGNGAVSITETVGTLHHVYLDVHYYDGEFKTARYDGGMIMLR